MSSLALDGTLPRSRRKDPTTSVDAGRTADLSASQRWVLDLFVQRDRSMADHELVAYAHEWVDVWFSDQRIRSARAELAAAGLLVLVEGVKRETPSGFPARVWALA